MSLARHFRRLAQSWQGSCSRLLSSQAQASGSIEGMPEFFSNPQLLSQVSANIGLARRRDLTFRQDIRLTVGDKAESLKELFKGEKAVVFGVPDCGKVCSEQHLPGYLAEADKLRQLGITKILCVAVGDPAGVQQWASELKVDQSKVQVAADTNGAWTRYLGLELAAPGQPGPRSLRYAAIVDDGILLKLKVDADPGKAEESSASTMLDAVVKMVKAVPHWGQ